MTIRHLRWATVIAPIAFLGVFTYVAHFMLPDLLDSPAGFALMLSLIGIAVLGFSQFVFGLVERLERQVLRQNRELSAVSTIATALSEPLALEEALQVSLDTAADVTGAPAGVICILDADREELHSAAHRGLSPEIVERVRRQKLGDDPVGSEVVRNGKLVMIADAFQDPRVAELCRREGYRSVISVPIKSEGKVVGVLALASGEENSFGEAASRLLERIGQQVGIAVDKAMLFRQLVQRNRDLAALNEVTTAVSSTLDLDGIMTKALSSLLKITDACSGQIWLVEERRSHLTLAAGAGSDDIAPSPEPGERVPTGEGLCGEVALSGEAAFNVGLATDGGRTLSVGCPLKSAGEIVGVLCLSFANREHLTERENQLLDSVTGQVGVAIKNAQLYQRVQDIAVLEERDRIAREMHDGFAQVLGYVNTKASAVRHTLAAGKTQEAGELVAQLEAAAREVYADVREAILGLRTTTQDSRHLAGKVGEYLELFGRFADIKARYHLHDGVDGLRLPVATEIQVLRIIQEALSNVRKHAGAGEVTVGLEIEDDRLLVTVADDGRGFDPAGYARSEWPQFGLQTMRERAEAVSGSFELESAHGRGTRVSVRIPLNGAEERAE